jgi:hypothetical protein
MLLVVVCSTKCFTNRVLDPIWQGIRVIGYLDSVEAQLGINCQVTLGKNFT